MSFLVDEDDAQATLQVALAFIDACDDSTNDSTSSSNNSSPTTLNSSSNNSPNSHTTTTSDSDDVPGQSIAVRGACSGIYIPPERLQQPQQGARTKRGGGSGRSKGNVEAVRRLREKKKAEAVYLREQVAQLEAKLWELQQAQKSGNSLQVYLQRMRKRAGETGEGRLLTGSGGGCGNQEEKGEHEDDEQLVAMVQPKDGAPLWEEIAAMQVQERLKSQTLNAELKDAVAKQVKLVESIEAMLANKANQFGLDLLRDEQKQFLHSKSVLAQETGILVELRYRIEQMYLRVDSLFAPQFWTEIADSVVCSIRLKHDPVSGPIVELRMNAPLPCSFQEAGEAIWGRTTNLNDLIQTPTYSMKKQLLSKTSLQKVFTLVLDGPVGPVELRGTAYVQRFTDANRFVYLWVSALRSNQGETYREQGWSIASACSSSSSSSSFDNAETQTLFRVYFQVACDSHEDAAFGSEARERREFVLKTLGNRTRAYHLYTQNLLDQFAGFQSWQPLLLTGAETC